jgi:TIR domain-containing protein
MSSIFVSYRRTDAPAHAGRIYERLVERFGKDNVYKDLDSTAPGADFAEVINEKIAGCDALVAVIGREWLSTTRRWHGRRLLEDPHDWVRREIAAALERNIRVVPVLVEGARMPSADDLPEDVKMLARRHAVELSETAWTPQLGQLIDSLAAAPPPTALTGDALAPVSASPHPPRRERTALPRLRAAAAALIVCGLPIGIAIVLVDGGDNDHGAGAGSEKAALTEPGSLSADEYRLQMADICSGYLSEAQRIGHAEGDRPVFGVTLQLERRTTDKLKTLRPPRALEPGHRAVLALWGRRLSLLGYYYDRYRREYGDPDFRREFERQLNVADSLSQAIQKQFVALGVTPECNLFT